MSEPMLPGDAGRALRKQLTQSVIAIFGVFALLDYLLVSLRLNVQGGSQIRSVIAIFAFGQAAMWFVALVLAERLYSWRQPPNGAGSRRARAALTTILAITVFVATILFVPRMALG